MAFVFWGLIPAFKKGFYICGIRISQIPIKVPVKFNFIS